jgi:two-component system alkaline phosphatase synthesis response regulator PhoP
MPVKDRKQTVLVVEDDEAIALGLEENLKYAGYEVLCAADGPNGLRLALERKPELIILDLMLPGMSGYEVCRELRDKGMQMPIIMLSARQEEFDKVHGFEMGADDYVSKPFSINELMARVKAVLVRGGRHDAGPRVYTFGECVLDIESRILTRKEREVPLTRTEFELLAHFCAHAGKVLSRNQLMNDIWGTEYYGTQRSLDSFVASLRAKIEHTASNPRHILTVHGVGYKFLVASP